MCKSSIKRPFKCTSRLIFNDFFFYHELKFKNNPNGPIHLLDMKKKVLLPMNNNINFFPDSRILNISPEKQQLIKAGDKITYKNNNDTCYVGHVLQ